MNETGRFQAAGFFNDTIMSAYLALVESTIPTLLKVADNTVQRLYSYYDYAKSNIDRIEHLAAVKDFLTYMDTLIDNATSPWREDAKPPNTDCGPGT